MWLGWLCRAVLFFFLMVKLFSGGGVRSQLQTNRHERGKVNYLDDF